ncbi:carbohydrate kinase family protein [Haloarchaeobius sp. HRN-SO-5]|uniref:carbohydrate kinase family protein n=1 Tax=Haloarchaeobius sp. HRN-SO-5 TaxID=3446118 RepID=UPI003EBA47D5
MARVLTAGHVNWDVTLRVDRLPEPDGESRILSQRTSGGGSAANVAVALSRLDVEPSLVGSVGDDEHGHLARRELDQVGVDLRGLLTVPDTETTVKYLLVDETGEVAVLGNDGANEAVRPDDVAPEHVQSVDHVHLTSQRPDTAARIAELAADAGIRVSFDPGRRLADRDFSAALDSSDVLFCNHREAETVLETEYPGSEFADRVLVVKRGSDGAVVHTPTATYEHPGFGVEPVDTTGAGDAFAAGFIAALLDAEDYERALEHGNACGAIVASREGARASPSTEALESFLAEQF